jgi:hypothetical protein
LWLLTRRLHHQQTDPDDATLPITVGSLESDSMATTAADSHTKAGQPFDIKESDSVVQQGEVIVKDDYT